MRAGSGSQVGVAAVAATVIMLVTGLVMGADGRRRRWASGVDVGQLVGAAAVTLPGGRGACSASRSSCWASCRARSAVVWAYVTYVGVVGLFGALLPDGSDVLSPFTLHAAAARRGDGLAAGALAARASCAVGADPARDGLAAFRRRDVVG